MSKELVDVLIKEVYNKLLKDVGPEGVKNVSNYIHCISVGAEAFWVKTCNFSKAT